MDARKVKILSLMPDRIKIFKSYERIHKDASAYCRFMISTLKNKNKRFIYSYLLIVPRCLKQMLRFLAARVSTSMAKIVTKKLFISDSSIDTKLY